MSHHEEGFLSFIKSLEGVLGAYDKNTEAFQRGQVEGLLAAERAFRGALIRHRYGAETYRAFVKMVMVEKRNLLMARPYFRERDTVFKAHIAHLLRAAAEEMADPSPVQKETYRRLYPFDINHQFISWAMKLRAWGRDPQSKRLMRLAGEVLKLRNALIECNLPLAISRARMFHARNRASHCTYLDFIQVAAGGLAAGVDKFCGEYTTAFRAVLIGRILGDLIEANSETLSHLYPLDKRRLYRIRKIASGLHENLANIDYVLLAKLLNKEELDKGESLTKIGDLHHLINAATIVQASTLPVGGEDTEDRSGNPLDQYADVAENRPDLLLEEAQSRKGVARAVSGLSVLDQKLLRLKGVDLVALSQ